MKTSFQHLRDTDNIGDRSCCPFDYFGWSNADVQDLRTKGPDYDLGIYGGGKIFGGLTSYPAVQDKPGVRHVAWGVSTVQNFPVSSKYRKSRMLCDLVGSRDYGDTRYDYAPCVSCMSPIFDDPNDAEHDVVFYFHGGKTAKQNIQIPGTIPSLSNDCETLERALNFISSGKTVVSNSYHGVYWALLMGRKSICIPFSKKFSAYRLPPHSTTPKRWLSELDQGRAYPDMLEICRAATLEFKVKVEREFMQ